MTVRIVHILHLGLPLCGFSMSVPGNWPPNHKWVGKDEAEHANCTQCRHVLIHPEAAVRPTMTEPTVICDLQLLEDAAGFWMRLCADGHELERWGPYSHFTDAIQASRIGAVLMREAAEKDQDRVEQ